MNQEEYLEEIIKVVGAEFADFEAEDIFYFPAYNCARQNIEWSVWFYLKRIMKQLLNDREHYILSTEAKSNKLFFNHTDQQNHVETFERIVGTATRKDVLRTVVTPRRFAKPLLIIQRLQNLLKWFWRWKTTKLSFHELVFVLPFAQLAQEAQRQFQKIDLKKYRSVIFYCDFIWTSSVLRQMAERCGCKTVSLQHGMPVLHAIFPEEAPGDKILATKAQYYLAWNISSKKSIVGSGVPEKCVFVLGMPRCIGRRLPAINAQPGNVFGVAVTIAPYEDRQIIAIANRLAQKTKMKFYVRYHPLQVGNEYDHFCDNEYYLGSLSSTNGFSIETYAQKVAFTLVGRSTTLVDLLCVGARAYHYVDKRGYGYYADTLQGSFADEKKIISYEQSLPSTVKELTELRDKLSGGDAVEQNYTDFFARL